MTSANPILHELQLWSKGFLERSEQLFALSVNGNTSFPRTHGDAGPSNLCSVPRERFSVFLLNYNISQNPTFCVFP